MKSKITFPSILCIAIGLFFSACNKNIEVKENNILFDSTSITEVYHLFGDPKYPNCNLNIQYIFPTEYNGDGIDIKSLQEIFTSTFIGKEFKDKDPVDALKAYKEDYIAYYKELETAVPLLEIGEDNEEYEAYLSFFEKIKNKIHFNAANLLSYQVEFTDYTGGAHGSLTLSSYTIDLSSGKLIAESDIFIEDYQDAIAKIIVNEIVKSNEVATAKDLEDIGYFSVDEIVPNKNFLVDEKGITYLFNEYEIAPYVMGTTEVFIPYSTLKPYIKDNSPLLLIVGF
ncbi:hypothetical protein AwDysgo_08740 [Bacteroidales bacterium]|nr:hypothetical protein AwDysgo_08740 [Bacteroidales bacterium]